MTDLLTLRPALLMRLQFIECLIANYGTINRAALCDYFGISVPQASDDLSRYFDLAPGNAEYDKSQRTYRRSESFKRLWPNDSDKPTTAAHAATPADSQKGSGDA